MADGCALVGVLHKKETALESVEESAATRSDRRAPHRRTPTTLSVQ